MGCVNSKPALDFIFYKFKYKKEHENQINLSYVGSTCDWDERMRSHKCACNNQNSSNYNYKIYQIMRQNGGWDAWEPVQIDFIKSICKKQARQREQYFIDKITPSMNCRDACSNVEKIKNIAKERTKLWREKNKEYNKNWYEQNKERAREYSKSNFKRCEQFVCDICGGKFTHQNRKRHKESKKHQRALKS